MIDHMRKLTSTFTLSLLLMITLMPLVGVEARVKARQAEADAYPYPIVSISGSGTLTSNVSGASVRISFALEGVFWTEQEVNTSKLNVTGVAAVYNVTGTITVEGEEQKVVGLFSNFTFGHPMLSGHFFAISVANITTEQLVFNAISPKKLLKETWPTKPWHNWWVKYTGALASLLVDSDYPGDFFLTKPPRFALVTIVFPK